MDKYWISFDEKGGHCGNGDGDDEDEQNVMANSNVVLFHLWHEDIFLGATQAGVGNPTAHCRSYEFHVDSKTLERKNVEDLLSP